MNIVRNTRLIKYFGVAVTVVCIELVAFQVIYLLSSKRYMLATVASFCLAVVLNWILGRKVVFGKSSHHPAKEFSMVLIASVVGLGIQLAVVVLSVDVLRLYPLIGKVLSIMFSFFWNYWFRAKFVYRQAEEPVID